VSHCYYQPNSSKNHDHSEKISKVEMTVRKDNVVTFLAQEQQMEETKFQVSLLATIVLSEERVSPFT